MAFAVGDYWRGDELSQAGPQSVNQGDFAYWRSDELHGSFVPEPVITPRPVIRRRQLTTVRI